MKRLLIAGVVLVLGIFMLPATRPVMEVIAAEVMSGVGGEPYAAFLQLFADHIYMAIVGLWIIVMVAIVFIPKGEEASEIQRR